ncbi:MAG: glutamate 5-kinase [Rhodospirillales bacterium CG15_BIG_FIL_POST_REV_8_21_14_020_66_15]|nr:MAG: glutamate 5-kinase [Rhodospirillales bacterium CG15_BIG_FIL_POST_REV_8_21_14_020_66_15]
MSAPQLKSGKRVIVKIGSALLVDKERGTVRRAWLETLAVDLMTLRERGQEVLLVSSGAIAVGRRHLGLPARGRLKLEESQAAAAAGMVRLAHAYQEVLGAYGVTVAQVLLTLDDSENRRRYLNARNTIDQILRLGAVPLINENDTVATDEIRFGDNDRLAARVAAMVSADTLVLLSSSDGLYDSDPTHNPDARHVPVVKGAITPEIEAMAGAKMTDDGSGGMVTKLVAARMAVAAGCRMVIANGLEDHPLRRLEDGGRVTWFLPEASPLTARKQWISGSLKPDGAVVVDDGAVRALSQGKSLLPAGVVEVEGGFLRGDAVIVKNQAGDHLGRGLIAYSAADARRIMGAKSREIEAILGYRGRDEMIHRDDLVLD